MGESHSRRDFVSVVAGAGASVVARAPARTGRTPSSDGLFNVRDFGATGNGLTLETRSLQAAINACGEAGGGTVLFPAGIYLTGTLQLRNGVRLHLGQAARIKGSSNLADYPPVAVGYRSYTDNYTDKCLIAAENLEAIGIEGSGVIDGQGAGFKGPYKSRPYMMRFVSCRDVTVRDVRIENSPMWVQHYLACENVHLTGLTVRSLVNHNNDGIDVDSCRRVRISDCDITSGDDAICLKSTSDRPCEDVVISNCLITSRCNAVKLGTESNGGFLGVAVSNCAISNTRLAGIAIETVDGGLLRGVTVSNVEMRNVGGAVFVRLGNRARPFKEGQSKPGFGALQDVKISGLHVVGAGPVGCSLTGLPGARLDGIRLADVSIEFEGGGTADDAEREVPELSEAYPEYSMFKTLPAYGFYIRHVRNIGLEDIRLSCKGIDRRPAITCDDVDGLEILGLQAAVDKEVGHVVRLRDVRTALISRARIRSSTPVFVSVRGRESDQIRLEGNALPAGTKSVEVGPDVGSDKVWSKE